MDGYLEAYIDDYEMEDEFEDDYTYHDVIREVLVPGWQDASNEEVDLLLEDVLSGMSPEEIEGFWSSLKSIGKGLGRVVSGVLPVAGQVIGGIYGGPAGAAIGGSLGGIAGKALGRAVGQRRPAAHHAARPAVMPRPGATGTAVPAGGSSATGQLMGLLQNPALLQILLGRLMGKEGVSSVPIGTEGKTASFGAFMNALSELAREAARESEGAQGTIPLEASYLTDSAGNLLCDSANPTERARLLMEHLSESSGSLHEDYLYDDIEDDLDGEEGPDW